MRKLFVFLVAIFLMATSAYAVSETETGPQNITTCYIKGTAALTSGSVVVLQTSSPTYWGREVTGTTTAGLPIYGVVVDTTDYSTIDMITPRWVRVQTIGYTPIVKLRAAGADTTFTANLTGLATSATVFHATTASFVSGNVVALETKTLGFGQSNHTTKALLK